MWEITTFFYDTCVPRDGDDKQESPRPVEKGERARLRVGGSHASLPMYTFGVRKARISPSSTK